MLDLVEHGVDGILLLGSRLKDDEVFKVGNHGEQDLIADRHFVDSWTSITAPGRRPLVAR